MNYSRRQLEAFGEPLGECVTRKEGGRIIYGGGGGGAPSTSTQVTDLPDWAKPYAQEALEQGKRLTSSQNIAQYDQPRIAGFSPMQQRAQETAYNMGTSGQLGTGTGLATAAGLMGLGATYQPGYFANQFLAPRQYQPSQFDMLSAQAPELQQFQMGPAQQVQGGQYAAPEMAAAQTQFRPDLEAFQMGPAERAQTQSFTQPGSAESYMSPYMQNVVDKQVREAERQAGLAAKQERAASIQRGAFGGGRTAVREAAAARDLAQLKSDIYGTGQQAAFQNAQQQFNAEQQARMQAQLANQQAGLTVGGQNLAARLGVQQLGTQTGLQAALANLSAAQQANVQNQAAQLQTQGLTANQAMQAALANQQAGLTTGQQNLAAQLGVQQLGAGQNIQAQLANQQAYQNMLQQREAARQFGYGQQMTAAQQRAQFGQAAQQLAEQSRQFGAGYGMQGLGTALQAAGQLGNLGQAEFGQTKDIIGLQSQLGGQQQALRQQGLTQAYQDFLNEQNYPYKQLGFYADLIRGLPLGQQSTKQVYESPGNMLGQIAGLGVGLGGMARFGSMVAEGGKVNGYAEGGEVTSDYKVDQILGDLSDVQLEQARLAALNRGDQNRLEMIDEERAERASLRAGLGNAFDSLPPDFREQVVSAASGGMIAFDEGGQVDRYQTGGVPGVPSWLQWMYSGESQKEKERRQQVQRQGEANRRVEVAGPEAGPLAPAGSGLGMLQRSTGVLPAGSGLSMMQQNLLNSPEAQRQLAAEAAAKREIEEKPRREAEAETVRESRRGTPPAATAAAAEAPTTQRARRQEASPAQAARIVADVAKTQVPKDDVKQLYEEVLKGMKSAPSEESEALARMLQKAEKRSEEIKARGVGEALMRFGFGMASAASKPGRRSGLAGALESAAVASPLLAESMAENEKLQSAADDNALKLRMEQARLKSATEQGNRQLAASLAGSISQRNIQQATLEEQIAQNARSHALKQQEMASMAAARAKPSSVMEYVYNTLSRDPKNAGKSPQELLNQASEIVNRGSLARTEMSGVNQAMKLKKELEQRRALFASSDSPLAKGQVALIDNQIAEINRQYGLGAGVTSGSSPGAGAGMRIVNVTE